jgi:transcription-repair coupling factor (superfamily II helicase)
MRSIPVPVESDVALRGVTPGRSAGEVATVLLATAKTSKSLPLIYVASDERRVETIRLALEALDPELPTAVLPAWDCLPYDRSGPSKAVMGRRAGALRWLTDRANPPAILLATPAALIQRAPPRAVWSPAHTEFRVGEQFDAAGAEDRLRRLGYAPDEPVDEPGEYAIRGRVLDLFPAAAPRPCRIEHDEGVIHSIRSYDPATQRSVVETELLEIDPASEIIVADDADFPEDGVEGLEHALPDFYPRLESVFDYAPDATMLVEAETKEKAAVFFARVQEAYEARVELKGRSAAQPVSPPDQLYLEAETWGAELQRRSRKAPELSPTSKEEARIPRFLEARDPSLAFREFLVAALQSGERVVLAGATPRALRMLTSRARRATDAEVQDASSWNEVLGAPPGTLLALRLPDAGFRLPAERISVVAASDLLGSRADGPGAGPTAGLRLNETEFRIGDAVIHLDHGTAVLEGLEETTAATDEPGEAIRLRYAGDARRMLPAAEAGRLWRYGSESGAVKLDRLGSDAWERRRAEIEQEIARNAERLVELAAERDGASALRIVPPDREYERFAAEFLFALTPDQASAIGEVMRDLASGRPMNRLVCGDVGFGKTEVALRAAAATVLSGHQVAIVAPTTVLARQHYETFRRRFRALGLEVGHLSRLVKAPEARRVKEGLASGTLRIVVGTHALAAKAARFKDLALVVIDEEQRFGARDKAKLKELASGGHLLTLTATPIPRTLQASLIGLQDLSVVANPPFLRQPIRTALVPFDEASIRGALLREKRRRGQSFFVCPRIEDIEQMSTRLRRIARELEVVVAHAKLPAAEMDDIMVRFADGEGDVLLATNIIESGLDVPNANTIFIWQPDRFGFAQLHQLRGRVGRGLRRGAAYLLDDPERKLAPATEKRLRAFESSDQLGAGFNLSARDLDLRGGGDLFGEEQAGHVRQIGVSLYQHLLQRALVAAKGVSVEDDWRPDLRIGLSGRIPEDYVPEPELRINLYVRLERLGAADEIASLEEEVVDRFGPPPESLQGLFALARLRARCRALGIARLDAGPKAIAAEFRTDPDSTFREALKSTAPNLEWRNGRLLDGRSSENSAEIAQLVEALLSRLERLASAA